MTKVRKERLHKKRELLLERAYELSTIEAGSAVSERAWRRFHRIDQALYRAEQKEWDKEFLKISRHPYGAFVTIPQIMCSLVERSHTYWKHGYNVHIVDEGNRIHDSVRTAYVLSQRVYDAYMTMVYHPGIVPNDFEDYQATLKEFFNFVADHCWDWGD